MRPDGMEWVKKKKAILRSGQLFHGWHYIQVSVLGSSASYTDSISLFKISQLIFTPIQHISICLGTRQILEISRVFHLTVTVARKESVSSFLLIDKVEVDCTFRQRFIVFNFWGSFVHFVYRGYVHFLSEFILSRTMNDKYSV